MNVPVEGRRTRGRRGIAMALVMTLLLVLATFAAIVRLLSHSAYRELDSVNAHLHAIAVGEVGFATLTSRIMGAPWSRRWFANSSEVRRDVAAAGGTYSYLIRDTPGRGPSAGALDPLGAETSHLADLLIAATYERSTVVMFWRLMVPEDSLDSVTRVVPSFFVLPVKPSSASNEAADLVAAQVDQALVDRAANTRDFDALYSPLRTATDVREVGRTLGFTPPGLTQAPGLVNDPATGNGGAGAGNANPADAVAIPTPAPSTDSQPSSTVVSSSSSSNAGTPVGELVTRAQGYLLPRLVKIRDCLSFVATYQDVTWIQNRVGGEVDGLTTLVSSVDPTSTATASPDQAQLISDSEQTVTVATQQMGQDPLSWTCP